MQAVYVSRTRPQTKTSILDNPRDPEGRPILVALPSGQGSEARRVVTKVKFHAEQPFTTVHLIVTSRELQSRAVVRVGNMCGTAEQWIGEGKLAAKLPRVSCHRFRGIEVRYWLSVIAYDLWCVWRRLATL
jgi:hypothetical protein